MFFIANYTSVLCLRHGPLGVVHGPEEQDPASICARHAWRWLRAGNVGARIGLRQRSSKSRSAMTTPHYVRGLADMATHVCPAFASPGPTGLVNASVLSKLKSSLANQAS